MNMFDRIEWRKVVILFDVLWECEQGNLLRGSRKPISQTSPEVANTVPALKEGVKILQIGGS